MGPKEALESAIYAAGNANNLAKKLGITAQAIYQWEVCPVKKVLDVERVTGISRSLLRPDIYPHEEGSA